MLSLVCLWRLGSYKGPIIRKKTQEGKIQQSLCDRKVEMGNHGAKGFSLGGSGRMRGMEVVVSKPKLRI